MYAPGITEADFLDLFGDSGSDEEPFEGFEREEDDKGISSSLVQLTHVSRPVMDESEWDSEDNEPLVGRFQTGNIQEVDFESAYEHQWLGNFSHNTGVLFDACECSESDILYHIIDDDVISLLVTETNRYASQYFEKNPLVSLPKFALARQWYNIDKPEMKAFLGILLLMGYVKFPTYDAYWNTDFLTEMKGFRSVMGTDR